MDLQLQTSFHWSYLPSFCAAQVGHLGRRLSYVCCTPSAFPGCELSSVNRGTPLEKSFHSMNSKRVFSGIHFLLLNELRHVTEGSQIVTAFIRPFCCEASDGKKERVSFSERILPTVCAQKALLQPGFSGVKKRPELLHSHLPPVWLPWASPHLLFCPGSGGWGW